MSEFDNSQWTVDQTLRWLTEGGPGRTPRFATRESALANMHVQLSDGALHMSGRPCLWENGDIAGRGDRQQIDGFQVIDLEFIAVPNTADYWLAPQGLKPFEANYSDKGNDDGTGAVHPPIFSGWCDLKLRRSKILASWPASAEISGKERRGRSPSPYYVPFRNWLLEQYISGRLSIDDDVAPAVLGIRGAWGRHCEVTKVAKAARPLPKERRLREVMGKIREEARAAKDD